MKSSALSLSSSTSIILVIILYSALIIIISLTEIVVIKAERVDSSIAIIHVGIISAISRKKVIIFLLSLESLVWEIMVLGIEMIIGGLLESFFLIPVDVIEASNLQLSISWII